MPYLCVREYQAMMYLFVRGLKPESGHVFVY